MGNLAQFEKVTTSTTLSKRETLSKEKYLSMVEDTPKCQIFGELPGDLLPHRRVESLCVHPHGLGREVIRLRGRVGVRRG